MSSLERDLQEYKDRQQQIESEVDRADRELKLAEAKPETEDILAVRRQDLEYQRGRLHTSLSEIEEIRQAIQRGR